MCSSPALVPSFLPSLSSPCTFACKPRAHHPCAAHARADRVYTRVYSPSRFHMLAITHSLPTYTATPTVHIPPIVASRPAGPLPLSLPDLSSSTVNIPALRVWARPMGTPSLLPHPGWCCKQQQRYKYAMLGNQKYQLN